MYEQELKRQLESIRQLVDNQAGMIAQFHAQLPAAIRAAVEKRRGELEKMQALTAGFTFPLVKSGMPEFRPVEVQRRQVKPLPRPAAQGFKPEPAIAESTYEELLGIIRHGIRAWTWTGRPSLRLNKLR